MFPREKEFIELLDKNKRPWIYQARRFKLSKTTYTPDFYLPEEDLYIEVVGTSQAYRANKEKIAEFKKLYPQVKFVILDYKGNALIINKTKKSLNIKGINRLNFEIDDDKHSAFKAKCAELCKPMKEVLDNMIDEYIAKGG